MRGEFPDHTTRQGQAIMWSVLINVLAAVLGNVLRYANLRLKHITKLVGCDQFMNTPD